MSEISEHQNMTTPIPYTAKDYVQEGLVSIVDGIENKGYGIHDENYRYFVNLVTGKTMAFQAAVQSVSKDGFVSNGRWFNHGQLPGWNEINGQTKIVKGMTLEWICDPSIKDEVDGTVYLSAKQFNQDTTQWSSVGFTDHKTGSLLWINGNAETFEISKSRSVYSLSYDFETGNYICHKNGEFRTGNESYAEYTPDGYGYVTGTKTHCCIRLYDRAISKEEMIHNYKVDMERFGL